MRIDATAEAVFVYDAYQQRESLRLIPGRKWDPYNKRWQLPMDDTTAVALRLIPGAALPPELAKLTAAAIPMQDAVAEDIAPVSPMPITVKPYAHQIAAYNQAVTAFQSPGHGVALFHEQGCGKTITAIAVQGRLFLDEKIRRVMVVAPLSVLPVWQQEIEQFSSIPAEVRLLKGSSEKRRSVLRARMDKNKLTVAVINYEAVRLLKQDLALWKPDMIICDEAQKIKNHQAQQSKCLQELGRNAPYRMILTGTPVANSPLDLWSQYRFLQPDVFESSYYAFRNHYAVMGGFENRQVLSYRHMDELTRKAHSIAHRVTKDQALDLPERIDQRMYCELEPDATRLYKTLARDKVAELESVGKITAPLIVTQMIRLSQITGGFAQGTDTDTPVPVSMAKLQLLKEISEDLIAKGEKVVIFCRFIPEIAAICEMANALVGADGYRTIYGDIAVKDRGDAVKAFQEDPTVKLFIANTATAGAGITLHAARTVIFYSLDYSFINYDQAKARIHRLGQHRPCNYIHLLAAGTIDETVIKALANKRDVASDVVDNWKQVFKT